MKIYVLGDFGYDNYHIGRVRGMSAEVPIPVVTDVRHVTLPGMAGNVAANLSDLGADTVELRHPSEENSIGCGPSKNRLVTSEGVQLARWDENDTCPPYALADLVPLMHADAVIVADYGKGAITPALVEVLAGVTMPIFVDTKQDPRPWMGSRAILFPNLAEYKQFEASYQWLPRVVLKLGAQGIAYIEYGKVILTRPSIATQVRCVNGAGDTVISAFALASLSGLGLPQCLEFASAAAANVVEQPPTERTTSTEEVLKRLDLRSAGGFYPTSNEVTARNEYDSGRAALVSGGEREHLTSPSDREYHTFFLPDDASIN